MGSNPTISAIWGISAAGSAPHWQCGGHGFESRMLHHSKSTEIRCIAPKTGSTGEVVTLNWYSGTYDMEKYYLSEVLCGNDSSPLSYRLMNSKLGDDLSPIWSNFGQFQEEFFTPEMTWDDNETTGIFTHYDK